MVFFLSLDHEDTTTIQNFVDMKVAVLWPLLTCHQWEQMMMIHKCPILLLINLKNIFLINHLTFHQWNVKR